MNKTSPTVAAGIAVLMFASGATAQSPGVLHDVGLFLMLLGIQYFVLDAFFLEHRRQQFRCLDRSRTN